MGMGRFREIGTYLQNASNKKLIFCEGKVAISTVDENVLESPVPGGNESEYPLRPCNHEEFDTRMMLHVECSIARV